jgi:quercetin dioxygenase-like cupin family protein
MLTRSQIMLIAAMMLSLHAAANAPAVSPQRTILQRHEQSEVAGKDIVIGTATLPSGTAIGFHTHPGDEIGYVLKGTLILKTRGQPDRILSAGDSFFNARGAIHSLAAAPGKDGGAAVSTWIVDQGKDLATPVP